MRYRIKTDRPVPPPSRPRVAPQPGPFAAVTLPATPLDVVWASSPVFLRAPAGWYRTGLFA